MQLASGVDLIEVERVSRAIHRYGNRFLERVFTQAELEDTGGEAASLAVRFAAKEAVSKALGTGIGVVGWHEIEIRRGGEGQPRLYLHGEAAFLAKRLGLEVWSLSLSHTGQNAIAFVVAIGSTSGG